MMATKMVMKRALTQVYSLLGTGIENSDAEMLDDAIENNNIEKQEPQPKEKITADQVKAIKKAIKEKGIAETAVLGWLNSQRCSSFEDVNTSLLVDLEAMIENSKGNSDA
jgi:hypothetical protein